MTNFNGQEPKVQILCYHPTMTVGVNTNLYIENYKPQINVVNIFILTGSCIELTVIRDMNYTTSTYGHLFSFLEIK